MKYATYVCTFDDFIGSHLFIHIIGIDYYSPTRNVWIYTGRTVGSFYFATRNDRTLERDETLRIFARPPSLPDGSNNCSATITIVDNDGKF